MTESNDWFADHLGPVELIALSLPDNADPAGWTALLGAVDSHAVRVLDLEFVRRNAADEVEFLAAEDLPNAPSELAEFEGVNSGLVGDEDAAALLSELEDGEVAALLVVEHLGLLPTLHAMESAGSRLLLDGSVNADDLDDALSASESDD